MLYLKKTRRKNTHQTHGQFCCFTKFLRRLCLAPFLQPWNFTCPQEPWWLAVVSPKNFRFLNLKWRNPHLYKLYGYGLCMGKHTPKIADYKVQYLHLLSYQKFLVMVIGTGMLAFLSEQYSKPLWLSSILVCIYLKDWFLYNPYNTLRIQSPCKMMIRVYNHLLRKVFRFHYHSQKVSGSLGISMSKRRCAKFFITAPEILSFMHIVPTWSNTHLKQYGTHIQTMAKQWNAPLPTIP